MRIFVDSVRLVFDNLVIPLVRFSQRSRIDKFSTLPLKHQPIFIIGAPRTGSTILYQALTNLFDLLYLDNLVCRWHGCLFFGFWLSDKLYGRHPHDNFQSENGSTRQYGGHAPSECGDFWYRWLPADRHFVDEHDITDDMVTGIRREITAVSNYFDRPVLFKNMNAGLRLKLIRKCFPDAKIIFLKRDLRYVVKSILHVREKNETKSNELWSLKPRDYEKLLNLPEFEMVVSQVCAIEQHIRTDMRLFPSANQRVVQFGDFSVKLVEELGRFVGAERRPGGSSPDFRSDCPDSLRPDFEEKFENAMHKYSMSVPVEINSDGIAG